MANKLFLATSMFLASSFCQVLAYTFMFTAHNRGEAVIANSSGEIFLKISAKHPQSADISADGSRIFISEIDGAKMCDTNTGKTLWKYTCPSIIWDGDESQVKKGETVRLENPVAQILGDGKFLVGNEGKSVLLEIDDKSNILKAIKSESLKKVKHGEFRLASKTRAGTYLFPLLSSNLLTEYDSNGKQILRIDTGTGVVGALRLDDGNILAAGFFGVAIFNREGKKVWDFSSKEIQKAIESASEIILCDVKILPNGNYLCTTYAGENVPDIIEISKDKKIVKKFDFPEYTHLSGLKILTDNQTEYIKKSRN